MRRKRLWGCLGVTGLGIAVLVAAAIRGLGRWLAPDTYGLEPAAFRNLEKAAAPVTTWIESSGVPPLRPNIVVVLADDLGYGDLGVQGSRAIRTPHIDRLAAEGVRFTSFYSSAPVCSPSRAGLLTGRYPLRNGIITALPAAGDTIMRKATRRLAIAMANLGTVDMMGGENAVMGLPPSEITMAEALKVAGYRTAAIGKWHLGDFTELPEYHPFNHGFDHFVGFNMSNDDWPVAFWRGKQEIVEDIGIDQEKYTALFTEEAIGFIEESKDEPFFLYLAHKDPHQPFYPSERFAGTSEGGPYGDAVSEFDWSVGEVIAALKRLRIEDRTLVVVTSDNGPWFEGSPGGLRGRKGQSYEGGFRVPLVAWWPGRVPAGAVIDEPSMNIDLFPTFMTLAGLDLPTDRVIDGIDLAPLLSGQQTGLDDRDLYFFHDYDVEAVRAGPWKHLRSNSHYVWPVPLDKQDNLAGKLSAGHAYKPPGSAESIPSLGTWPLLYHLQRDPGEAYNVATTYPDVVRALEQRMDAWRDDFYANPRGWR